MASQPNKLKTYDDPILDRQIEEIIQRLKSPRVVRPVFADNASALAGGLVAGQEYRTATGAVMQVY